ncbi:MAG: SDR family oxidoreductase [Dehalococcoidales bacterium]|nr:SDR family oxidoreductase [Dehalococcoidales bacterium]
MIARQDMAERSVVITGASRGIGEACALYLDKLGFRVFAGVRQAVDGNGLRQRASSRLTPILLDVTDIASIESAADTVARALGVSGLWGLVNNAGIAVAGPIEFLPLARIRRQFEVNVIGQIAVIQAFLPLLRKASGRIINVGSKEGLAAMPFLAPYCASKFALEAVTDSLRMELRPWGIAVSMIEPGTIATTILEKSVAAAEETVSNLSSRAHTLYDAAITSGRKAAGTMVKRAAPASTVARVVARALTVRKPKSRYLIGQDAKIVAILARFVPDRLRDWLILQQMGLLKPAPNVL